jgi:hypothetical protein
MKVDFLLNIAILCSMLGVQSMLVRCCHSCCSISAIYPPKSLLSIVVDFCTYKSLLLEINIIMTSSLPSTIQYELILPD